MLFKSDFFRISYFFLEKSFLYEENAEFQSELEEKPMVVPMVTGTSDAHMYPFITHVVDLLVRKKSSW